MGVSQWSFELFFRETSLQGAIGRLLLGVLSRKIVHSMEKIRIHWKCKLSKCKLQLIMIIMNAYHKDVDQNKEPFSLVTPLLLNGDLIIYFLEYQILKMSHSFAKRFHLVLASISSAYNCCKNKYFPLKSKLESWFLKLIRFTGDDKII